MKSLRYLLAALVIATSGVAAIAHPGEHSAFEIDNLILHLIYSPFHATGMLVAATTLIAIICRKLRTQRDA